MPRKPNYNFEKQRKEQERKKKKEDKARRRAEHTSESEPSAEGDVTEEPGASE